MRKYWLLVISLLFSLLLSAQIPESKKLEFANYLIKTHQADELLFFVQNYLASQPLDTIFFLKANAFFEKEKNDSAAFYFSKISEKSVHYFNSQMQAILLYANEHQIDLAENILNKTTARDSITIEIKKTQQINVWLLKREFGQMKSYSQINQLNEKQSRIYFQLSTYKPKSKYIAALLSAIIPGAGKIYAGKTGEGVSAFFTIMPLATLTYEAITKAGMKNWRPYVYGAAFLTFYMGNIAGSMISIKATQHEFNHQMDNQILLDMRIPIRTFIK